MNVDLDVVFYDQSLETPLECFQEIEESLVVMRHQELTTYRCDDYLSTCSNTAAVVDETLRQRMCEWMHLVADHYCLDREVVVVAVSYVDLFLSREKEVIDSPRDYQLAAMACFYLSLKLNNQDSELMDIESMRKLGRGIFTVQDLATMESRILHALDWKLNPPSPSSFLHMYLELFPHNLSPSTKYIVTEVSKFILEMCACVYKFVACPPSVMAYGAMLIAMDNIDQSCLPMRHRLDIRHRMSRIAKLSHTSEEVVSVQRDLELLLLDQQTEVKSLMRELDPQGFVGFSSMTERKVSVREVHDSPRRVLLSRYVSP